MGHDLAADARRVPSGRGSKAVRLGRTPRASLVLVDGGDVDRGEALLDRPVALVRGEEPLPRGDKRPRRLVQLAVSHAPPPIRICVRPIISSGGRHPYIERSESSQRPEAAVAADPTGLQSVPPTSNLVPIDPRNQASRGSDPRDRPFRRILAGPR